MIKEESLKAADGLSWTDAEARLILSSSTDQGILQNQMAVYQPMREPIKDM